MYDLINDILHDLQTKMKVSRYNHTLGVAYTAAALCMNYDTDVDKGMLAGVLHDCAKITSISDNLEYCTRCNIPVLPQDEVAPHLLHAQIGAYIAQQEYGVNDPEILHAIKVHTLGCENMCLLDKILFIADYIEPNRDKEIPNIKEVRKLAFEDIDQCLLLILEQTLQYLHQSNYYIDDRTITTYNYYKNIMKSQEVHHE